MALNEQETDVIRQVYAMSRNRPRVKRLLAKLAPEQDEVQIGKHRMMLYPRENVTDRNLWFERISPEQASLERLCAEVANRKVLILDIGANCGSFTLPLVEAAGASSRVLAFEPNPVMHERLVTNLKINDLANHVEVHKVALGAEEGSGQLSMVAEGNYGQATMRDTARGRKVSVPIKPLSDFLGSAADFDRVVLKIDVEGYEDRVFGGFFKPENRSIFPDVILMETEHRKQWSTDLCGMLEGLGYSPTFEGDGNTLYVLEADGNKDDVA